MLNLIATCPDETKEVLIKELKALGAVNIVPRYRAVRFSASEKVFYEVHLKVRTASRILLAIKDVPAASPEMLYSQSSRIHWAELFDPQYSFLVEGIVTERGAGQPKSNDVSKKVKEGLWSSFERHSTSKPVVDLKDPKVTVVAFVEKGRCTISFDTSGKSLHKRGYRLEGHPAPLKETLASSILMLAGYDGTGPLWDPMCGSGTIVIEAAMMALGKASQIHRKKGDFGFEWLNMFNRDLWRKIQDEARLERSGSPGAPIWASDINVDYLDLARKNALRARVEKDIEFKSGAFQDMKGSDVSGSYRSPGLVIANLPYGERLERASQEKLQNLYKEIGDTLKRNFAGWKAALLAAEASPYKFIGLRPKRKISLLNGSLPVKLLCFELYEGKKSGRPA